MPPEKYVALLTQELRHRAVDVPYRDLTSIYFGGGTPSLLEPSLILTILDELAKAGFKRSSSTEMTIEIDPTTVDEARLDAYLNMGMNRFSVGAQTFNSRLLKVAGRHHSREDTIELLTLLKSRRVNYSFDLLFALPSQTPDELREDLATALSFDPAHVSAYYLTVPESHPLSRGRAADEAQVEMFELMDRELEGAGLLRYEISNYAKPGMESIHNGLYWTDQAFWGLGTGAHSYFPHLGEWGTRFGNEPSLPLYEKAIGSIDEKAIAGLDLQTSWKFTRDLPERSLDILQRHEALTDFCHTSLRMVKGVDRNALRLKFGVEAESQIAQTMGELMARDLVSTTAQGWTLSKAGRLLSNVVFEKLTQS